MSDAELLKRFSKRAESWARNGDDAWVHVKLGEMRAVLRLLSKSSGMTPPSYSKTKGVNPDE